MASGLRGVSIGSAGQVDAGMGGGGQKDALQKRDDYKKALKYAMRIRPGRSRDRPPHHPSVCLPHLRCVYLPASPPLLSLALTLCEMEALAETWGCHGNLP